MTSDRDDRAEATASNDTQPDTNDNQHPDVSGESSGDSAPKKKRRRRRRGKRGGKKQGEGADAAVDTSESKASDASESDASPDASDDDAGEGEKKKKKGDGKRKGRKRHDDDDEGDGKKRRKRKRSRSEKDTPEPERHRKEKTTNFTAESFATDKTFADLGLKDELVAGLTEAGFKHPTHIQSQLIPLALTGVDILGQAKTGTGKTLSFGLPILSMAEAGVGYQALILAPTRELAIQIRQDLDEVAGPLGIRTAAVYGGQSINVQADILREEPEIIVGTPGRVMDMVGRGHMTFSNVRFAVLDEVDRMFDFGFRDDMKKILSACPRNRQTVFVSATLTEDIEKLARKHMSDPEKLTVSSGSLTVEMVKQMYVSVEGWDKKRMLAHLLTHEEPALTLVFCRMKRTVDGVVRYLDRKGIDSHAIHGDLSQAQRNKVMDRFRSGSLSVLVASDLASRGIDVDGITHVVNFDLPEDPDIYVHRIGRTARAGREGEAWSLVTPAQGKLLTEIEHLINAEIPEKKYPEFEASERPEGWREEQPGGRRAIEIKGASEEPKKNRYAGPEIPAVEQMNADEIAAKFPGGIVPKKRPKRTMGGRVRGRGGR